MALTAARVLAITDRCTCCHSKVRAIVGVTVGADAASFLPVAEVGAAIARAADPGVLAARRIAPLRQRSGIPGGYHSNGCLSCDALVGRLRLERLLDRHLAGGGTYGQLDAGIQLDLALEPAAAPLRRIA
ncbi:MAG: hypothetical protein QOC78_3679 [Solirubrobacteraceae bacterium]|jgi:hypothetical protein|nr:hypothetical protein [Solirubrobacteraceae bacterium]